MDWYPQAPLTAFQACCISFLEKQRAFTKEMFAEICQPVMLLNILFKTPSRRGAQFYADNVSIFVLNSHLDPIGDQNAVQYLLYFGTQSPHPHLVVIAANLCLFNCRCSSFRFCRQGQIVIKQLSREEKRSAVLKDN